jgi:hypothetical protein
VGPVAAGLPLKQLRFALSTDGGRGEGNRTEAARVEVRVEQLGHEIAVDVRAADPDLARRMKEQLPELMERIEQQGFRAETWNPAETSVEPEQFGQRKAEEAPTGSSHSGGDRRGGGFGQPSDTSGQQRRQPPQEALPGSNRAHGAGRASLSSDQGFPRFRDLLTGKDRR